VPVPYNPILLLDYQTSTRRSSDVVLSLPMKRSRIHLCPMPDTFLWRTYVVSRNPKVDVTTTKKTSRFKMQPRDQRIVHFAAAHGYVTMPQIKLFAFENRDEWGQWKSVSGQAVYRRLKRLCEAGLLVHQRTWYGDHGIYRSTRKGLSRVGLNTAPARLDKRDYEHDLLVVDLALGLTDYTCDGWITERLIRSRLRPGASIGRVPDGVLVGHGGERWAIELEVSGKEAQRYHDACHRYAERQRYQIPQEAPGWNLAEHLDAYVGSGGEVDGVVWYFFSETKRRRALAAAERVIAEWGRDYYRTDHLRFRFQGADPPRPPPFDKWEEQQENELQMAIQLACERREEEERQETERRRAEAVESARLYLTWSEQERAVEVARRRKREEGRGRELTGIERDETLIDAVKCKRERKREKERKKQRRREKLRNLFGGHKDRS
jgi:hypothetical protein